MKNFFSLALVLVIGAVSFAQGKDLDENLSKGAETFVQKLGDRAIEILQHHKGLDSRKHEFRGLFEQYFANRIITKSVVGHYWRAATAEQQDELVQLFKEKTFNIYTSRLQDYGNQSFLVTGSKQMGSNKIEVISKIKSEDNKNIELIWSVGYDIGNKLFRIVDVKVEGISQVATQRSEVSNTLKNKGIEGLLDELRNQKN